MNRFLVPAAACAAVLFALTATAQAPKAVQSSKSLRIYFVDVEGGQSTLYVAPTGQSLLVDTGWSGANSRDANRIVKAAHDAGLTRIDTVLITHYHVDHAGGIPQLAAAIPIGRFLDHGPNTEFDHGVTEQSYAGYQKVLADKNIPHQSLKPGDSINALPGVKIQVISSNGDTITTPAALPGGVKAKLTPNPYCAASPIKPAENSENDRSLGILLTYNHTRILDLGDLTWARERPLTCPANLLGMIDVYVASHHGFDRSGSPAFVDAIAPRVAIMDNGGHKGADPGAWTIVEASPRIKSTGTDALWQLHTNEARNAHNVDNARIANLSVATGGPTPDAGNALVLTIAPAGTMSMLNQRTGESVAYPAK